MRGACRPRQMFPPPTTTATCTPRETISRSCVAIRAMDSAEMPNSPPGGAKASPESLRRTRRYSGGGCSTGWLGLLAHFESCEPADQDVFLNFRGNLFDQVAHLLGVLPDILLVEQDGLLVEGLQLSLDDLRDDMVGLARSPGLFLVDLPLPLDDFARDLVPGHPSGIARGHLHRHFPRRGCRRGPVPHELADPASSVSLPCRVRGGSAGHGRGRRRTPLEPSCSPSSPHPSRRGVA